MMKESAPNRNEVSDIAYAITDGIDGVVLSDITSDGLYPDVAVSAMARCITEAEKATDYKAVFANLRKYG